MSKINGPMLSGCSKMPKAECFRSAFPPRCFDGAEEDLASLVVEVHDHLVSAKGFNPNVSQNYKEEMTGRIVSVISSSFSTYFGCSPVDKYLDIFEQIADFAMRLSRDHIFPDGNKRTTVVISMAILHISGVVLDIEDPAEPDGNEIYLWIQDVVAGGKTKEELAQILRDRVKFIPD